MNTRLLQTGRIRATTGLSIALLLAMTAQTATAEPPVTNLLLSGGDPLIDRQQLVAAAGFSADALGFSLALDGPVAVVGAQTALIGNDRPGAAFVFEFDPGSGQWLETATLSADDGADLELFGTSVALSGDTLVVGAPGAMIDLNVDQGAAYVFVRNNSGLWAQQAKLVADDGAAGDAFGVSVTVDGDFALMGTELATVSGNFGQGAAYAYRRNPASGNWAQEDKLIAPDGVAQDRFGFSLDVSGGIAAVSAYNAEGPMQTQTQGAVYVFERAPGGQWNFHSKLFAFDGTASDNLGFGFPGVAIDGAIILVGAAEHMNLRGAAYTFARDPLSGVWLPQDKLIATDGEQADQFGQSVALSGGTALIGAPFAAAPEFRQGAAYFFTLQSSGNWLQRQRLTSDTEGMANDNLGRSVALSAISALTGAPFADPDGNTGQGAAYIFSCGDVLFADNFEAVSGCAL